MHEYSIVESMVKALLKQLEDENVGRVVKVRFRRGSAFEEEVLRQSFAALAAGTILEGAELQVDTVNVNFECQCGHRQVINSEDLVGHMFLCPNCGAVRQVEEAHDIQLVDVVAEEPKKPGPG